MAGKLKTSTSRGHVVSKGGKAVKKTQGKTTLQKMLDKWPPDEYPKKKKK